MWYGKYDNYTDDDWGDNIFRKEKQITLDDLKKSLDTEILKTDLEIYFHQLLSGVKDA